MLSTPRQYAYLRIAEGAKKPPRLLRDPSVGKLPPRRMEDILQEAQALADDGVQECIVIAQDITPLRHVHLYGSGSRWSCRGALCRLPFH